MEIKPSRLGEFDTVAKIAIAHKAIYQAIEEKSGVPWPLIAVLHRRESDANFNTYLGNGDPLDRPTTHKPVGRGPFDTFEEGALDALHLDGLDRVMAPWPVEKMLYWCEIFNGTGYYNHGLPSPYIWGGTNEQKIGKYISDDEWDPNVWDTQPGCAPMLAEIAKLDSSVVYIRESPDLGLPDDWKTALAKVEARITASINQIDATVSDLRQEVVDLQAVRGAGSPVVRPPDKPVEIVPMPTPTQPVTTPPVDIAVLLQRIEADIAKLAAHPPKPTSSPFWRPLTTILSFLPGMGALATPLAFGLIWVMEAAQVISPGSSILAQGSTVAVGGMAALTHIGRWMSAIVKAINTAQAAKP